METKTESDLKKADPKEPKCSHCNDTGLYDAGCRPYPCDCEAAKQFYRVSTYSPWY